MNTFFSDKIILWRKMTKIWLKIWLKVKENGTKKFKLAKMVAKEKKILVRTLIISMHIASLVKKPCYLLKLSSRNKNMGVSRKSLTKYAH